MAELELQLAPKLDTRAVDRAAQDLLRRLAKTGDRAGDDFRDGFESRLRQIDASRAAKSAGKEFADEGARSGRDFGDGATRAVRQSDWAGAARASANDFSRTFERQANPRVEIDTSTSRSSGAGAGDSFASGFGASAGLARLASAAGPIGAAVAAGAIAGLKLIGPQIQAAMKIDAAQDLTAAQLGFDPGKMKAIADAAGKAYADNWGASVEANLSTAGTAVTQGLLAPTASSEDVQKTIAGLETISTLLGTDITETARAAGQAIKTGLAQDAASAFDLLAVAQQSGANQAGDLLDTLTEYGTQFRKLGLDGPQAVGLISQALRGGARDADVAADSLKEFSIRAIDGSTTTANAFQSLGLNASTMAAQIAGGGPSAAAALDTVLDGLRGIKDPVEQARIAVELFGTQSEDLGRALNTMDLTNAVTQFGDVAGASDAASKTLLSNSQNEWETATRNLEGLGQRIRTALNMSEWFSSIPQAINRAFDGVPSVNVPTYTGPPPVNALPGLTTPGATIPGSGQPGSLQDMMLPGRGIVPAPAAPPPPPVPPLSNLPGPPTRNYAKDWYPPASPSSSGGPTSTPAPVAPYVGDPAALVQQQGMPLTSASYGAAQQVLNAQNERAQAEAKLNQLQQDNNATADQIQAAKNDKLKAEQDLQAAQLRMNESALAATTKMTEQYGQATDSLNSIGTQLDKDFGVSKGLPGIVENLTKFASNLAAAPYLGQLQAIVDADPRKGGYGALGILGAQGAFGPEHTGMPQQGQQGYTTSGGGEQYGGNVNAALALAQQSSGKVKYGPASDLMGGLADCSGSISDLVEVLQTGTSSPARLFTTTNFATDAEAAKLGFMPGFQPGALNVGVNPYPGQSGHMAATLPNGVNFEGGGGTGGGAQYGGSASGALDPQFEKRYYLPVGGMPVSGAVGNSPMPGGQLPVPLPVTIVGGAMPAIAGAPAPGAPAAPAVPGAPPAGGPPLPGAPAIGGPPGAGNLFSPENTNPGLNNPAAPTSPVGGSGPANWSPQGGGGVGINGGGAIQGAIDAAASAFPGAGQAAQTGIKLINRTVEYGGQLASTAASGLLETFGLSSDGAGGDLSKSWLGRVASGIAGAAPALPNAAGQSKPAAEQDASKGGTQHEGSGAPPGPAGPTVHIENLNQKDGQSSAELAKNVAFQSYAAKTGR
ncbi:phage tail tape measure protein [Mycobacterium antarcticum]|uniref:phage tail tape measure protein n=1 Tax=Mycolicibacterium sp. TUM20984 TaxID=3023368 RepID=UPI002399F119|nr:phage tail tape measure protein [Mycolicibacterium sp. TUM20984]GLP83598.1 hypothetical protein TUM20984_50180 [Mycolicibacterium sp. TUM20984]